MALPTMALIPRPTAAGVFGIERITGASAPKSLSKAAIGEPAAI